MSEKIFGEIKTTEELNELANNLRKTKEFDEIRLLCSENGIPEDTAEEFINGNQVLLVADGYQEEVRDGRMEQEDITAEDCSAPQNEIGRAIESIERDAYQRISEGHLLTDSGKEDEDAVPMGTCSLNDIVTGIPKPTDEEVKAAEQEQKAPPAVHTIEDVKKKLEAELKIYKDGDSKYVIEKLIHLCEKDKELLNAIMLPHKSYDKAFQYFYEKSRNVGYKMPHGNMVYLDNDKAVELSIEYFKRDDSAAEAKKTQHKEKPKKQDKKVSKNTGKKEPKANPKETEAEKAPIKAKQEFKKKKELDGQISLFDL